MAIQPSSNPQPARVFLSYAHVDELLLKELKKHLAALQRQGIISTWHDRDITAGSEWAGSISRELEEADVILLLISPDFIASEYCSDIETRRAMERHNAGEALVIPVFLRYCEWKGEVFGKLQGLPTDARPVTGTSWSSHDEAFAAVAAGIRKAIDAWRRQGHAAEPPAPSRETVPQPTPDMNDSPSYKKPRLRPGTFNPYQGGRDILAFLEREIAARMADMEAAGYLVDHHQRDGRVCFRVEAEGRTLYFLDMWQGGLGGDKGLGFYDGWGNRVSSGNSMTATATVVPDDYTGEAKLDVVNFSLLGHGSVQKVYGKDEFLDALWDKIVDTVDQLGKR